jgi:hypothetical protein
MEVMYCYGRVKMFYVIFLVTDNIIMGRNDKFTLFK